MTTLREAAQAAVDRWDHAARMTKDGMLAIHLTKLSEG